MCKVCRVSLDIKSFVFILEKVSFLMNVCISAFQIESYSSQGIVFVRCPGRLDDVGTVDVVYRLAKDGERKN